MVARRSLLFLSTPSARRATPLTWMHSAAITNFYPRPPRGGRQREPLLHNRTFQISIHALREEGDLKPLQAVTNWSYFYPRPPRGGRPMDGHTAVSSSAFLSTPSARRATYSFMALFKVSKAISIHALREEGDTRPVCCCTNIINFYPRPPRGGRLLVAGREIAVTEISIHALREEGDRRCMGSQRVLPDFYPRPPRGGRRAAVIPVDAYRLISIHALREEGDRRRHGDGERNQYFYPRPPRGGRPNCPATGSKKVRNFYPRPPRGGRHSLPFRAYAKI